MSRKMSHSRRVNHGNENRRRLSKQEEIDLGGNECDDIARDNGKSRPSVTIRVEDQCDTKSMNNKSDSMSEEIACEETQLSVNDDVTIHKRQSSLGSDLNVTCNNFEADDIKDKKKNKQLLRSEAFRDISPPPDYDKSLEIISSDDIDPKSGINSPNEESDNNDLKEVNSDGSGDSHSPNISRDSTGIDLEKFLIETLKTNKNGRILLLKVEQELTQLVKDTNRQSMKFNAMSSYNRMLVHRVSAYFGFDHNIEMTEQGVGILVNKTKNARIPELKFRDYIKNDFLHEPKKLILKRDSASLEETGNQSDNADRSPDRQTNALNSSNKSKSFEEREERYEKARARIFNQESSSGSSVEDPENTIHVIDSSGCVVTDNPSDVNGQDEMHSNWVNDTRPWSSTESDNSGRMQKSNPKQTQSKPFRCGNSLDSENTSKSSTLSSASSSSGIMLLTPDNCINIAENVNGQQLKTRPQVTKASSFGGISVTRDNSTCNNSTQSKLTKCGSLTATALSKSGNCSPSITPKISYNAPQENAHTANIVSVHQTPIVSQVLSAPNSNTNVNTNANASHLCQSSHPNPSNHQQWLQNAQQNVHVRYDIPVSGPVNWAPMIHNYSPLLMNPNDSNVNPKDQALANHVMMTQMHGFTHPIINTDQSLPANHDTQQQTVMFIPYMPNHASLGFNPQAMQMLENSTQRSAADAIVSQIGAVSLNSPSPPMQHQFQFIRPHNNHHSNMNQNISNNPQRMPLQTQPHINQQLLQNQIRLIYPNQSNAQSNMALLGSHQIGSFQNPQIPVQNHANQSVPYHIQPQMGFSPQSAIQSNSNIGPIVPQNISQFYGTQMQVPQGLPMYLLNNTSHASGMPANHAPLIQTQSSLPAQQISSNIAPFVGMSYQQYRPTVPSSAQNSTFASASQNAILKSRPMVSNPAKAQRFTPLNGNHLTPQVPDLADINMFGAKNYNNRTPQPFVNVNQMNQLYRRFPLIQNQSLDVRLMGSHPSPHFLLSTPQHRPFVPYANPNPLMHQQIHNRPKGFAKNRRPNSQRNSNSSADSGNTKTHVPNVNGPLSKSSNGSETHSLEKSANDRDRIHNEIK